MNIRPTRLIAASALALTLGLTMAPALAGADTSTTTAPSTTVASSAVLTPQQVYRSAMASYLRQLRVINRTYRSAIATARASFEAVVAKNPGPTGFSARLAARTAFDVSQANAADARATALTALGAPPVNPGRSKGDQTQDKAYRAVVHAYMTSVRAIDQTYRSAVASAYSTLLTIVEKNQGSAGSAARATARIAYANAVAAAASARLASITALGTPPSPPTA